MTAGNSALRGQARLRHHNKHWRITSRPCRRSNARSMGPKRKSATAMPTPASALEQLHQSQSLKLLAIAETLSPKDLPQSAKKRSSAVSEDSEQNGDTHPAALEADLLHYKVCTPCGHPSTLYVLTDLPGTLQQTPLQLCRASHQGEVPAQHNREPTASRRSSRERREGGGDTSVKGEPEGAQAGGCGHLEAAGGQGHSARVAL